MASVVCPACKHSIVLDKRPADGRIACESCGKTFRIKAKPSHGSRSAGARPQREKPRTRTAGDEHEAAKRPAKEGKRPPKSRFVAANKTQPGPDDLPELDSVPSQRLRSTPLGRAAGKAEPTLTVDQVLNAFEGPIERPTVGLQYRLSVVLVGCVMLLLPLLYVALTAFVMYATYWFATTYWDTIWLIPRIRVIIVAVCLYLTVLFGGVIASVFMLKPIFSRRRTLGTGDGFDREDQPTLFAFADRVAEIVGSPKAEVIRSSFEPNASASYSGGLFGILGGRFELTIGLPLIDGMSLPAVAGIMAHEFGHFSQAGGRFFGRCIRQVNGWLLRTAYERDEWDDWLSGLTDNESVFLQAVGFFGWVGVSCSRIVLGIFARIGFAASSTLAKQMEFHADSFESALVGSKQFQETRKRLMELSVAANVAGEHLLTGRDASHLPNDYFRFVTLLADDLPKGARKKAIKMYKATNESIFDTHPSTARRVERAKERDEPGVFHLDRSARGLQKDLPTTRKDLTELVYLMRFGDTGESTQRSPKESLRSLKEIAGD